ncbi:hypothetical protein SALB1_1163 [Salinisphaera sp. LB1]|nr:hypothetical protein SALB1_1163 [Salinisphaera sp. LB1]
MTAMIAGVLHSCRRCSFQGIDRVERAIDSEQLIKPRGLQAVGVCV